jgi:arabinan endo-1,5-alpha-L-arabinosidase
VIAVLTAVAAVGAIPATAAAETGSYRNPPPVYIPGGGKVESCADPSLIKSATDRYWYMYCTTDPLNDEDKTGTDFNFHLVPQLRSLDLVHWTYMGDAFTARPAWADPTAGIWAPEIDYFNGKYYLYFGVTDVSDATSGEPGCHGDNAIGVATGPTPLGPWTYSATPVVEPRRNGPGCNFFWTFDPEVFVDATGQKHIYYGSYYGGIQERALSANGLSAPAATATQIAIPNRYEGAEVVRRSGFYYLFVSAANCCNGALTGYSVFVGRSASPEGPFVDKAGQSFLTGRVGGTVALSFNGNRFVGPGHNSVFVDYEGQWWTVYHAVNRGEPVFAGTTDFTKRPVLLDPVDWIGGWPTVRAGRWVSDRTMAAPAAQPGQTTEYYPLPVPNDRTGNLVASASDEFDDGVLNSRWHWVRPPDPSQYQESGGEFRFEVQKGDLYQDSNSAPVLWRAAPHGTFMVETKVRLNVPDDCCHNYTQAGIVLYDGDDAFVKAVVFKLWETQQTEFAKEVDGRYGNTVVGPPGDTWTWLRVVKRALDTGELYTVYSSRDGVYWERGGTWTHRMGDDVRIGLISMAEPGDQEWTAWFDYVRVYRLYRNTFYGVQSAPVFQGMTDLPR